jgi:hypothetical protein
VARGNILLLLKWLYQMRTKIEQFVEDKHWETYINKETSWNQADFEPEILMQIAAEAKDLLALGVESYCIWPCLECLVCHYCSMQ